MLFVRGYRNRMPDFAINALIGTPEMLAFGARYAAGDKEAL